MIISAKPTDLKAYSIPWVYFESARAGLREILRQPDVKGKKILLPAYIGVDSKGESGIMDPIREAGNEFEFYRIRPDLRILYHDLQKRIRSNGGRILFLVHYFGFVDREIRSIRHHTKDCGLIIIEDFAHALFTFWQDPVIDFDYAIFSLHKMFPIEDGGAVFGLSRRDVDNDHNYDWLLAGQGLRAISLRRRDNYFELLGCFAGVDIPVLPYLPDDYVPQSFPVLLPNRETRDKAYHAMREAGYGVTALWHTLSPEIGPEYDIEHDISDRILNLPCHQDCEEEDLQGMVDKLIEVAG